MTSHPRLDTPARPHPWLGFVLGAVGVVIFAGTLPATRVAVVTLDPWWFTAARATIAGGLALCWLAAARPPWPTADEWRRLVVVAGALVLGFPLLMALGTVTVPASHGGVVLAALPLTTAALAALVGPERPSKGFWLAAAVAAALVLSFALTTGSSSGVMVGDLFLLGAVLVCSVGYVVSGTLARRLGAATVISWALVLNLPLAVVAVLFLWPNNLAQAETSAWWGLLYVAVMSQWLGFFAWNRGLVLGGIARVSQIQHLQTFVTLGLSAWLLEEVLDQQTLLYAFAVVVTVVIGARMRIHRVEIHKRWAEPGQQGGPTRQ
ncbi:MAG: DMT family transporter [Candidatus Competibacterales bacterium]